MLAWLRKEKNRQQVAALQEKDLSNRFATQEELEQVVALASSAAATDYPAAHSYCLQVLAAQAVSHCICFAHCRDLRLAMRPSCSHRQSPVLREEPCSWEAIRCILDLPALCAFALDLPRFFFVQTPHVFDALLAFFGALRLSEHCC